MQFSFILIFKTNFKTHEISPSNHSYHCHHPDDHYNIDQVRALLVSRTYATREDLSRAIAQEKQQQVKMMIAIAITISLSYNTIQLIGFVTKTDDIDNV